VPFRISVTEGFPEGDYDI
jgi:hypothetical protein